MKIDRQQMRAMIAGSDEMLRLVIKKQVKQEYAYIVNDLPEDLLDNMIDHGLKATRYFHQQSPQALATFVLLMFEFGPQFYRHPDINRILIDVRMEPEARLAAVVENTPNEVWQHCEAVMHKQSWFPELHQAEGE